MPLPSEVHVNAALTNFSVRYTPGRFIADKLAPRVPVTKLSDSYFVYGTENMIEEPSSGPLGPKSPAPERGHTYSTATYSLDRYSLKDLVTDEAQNNADPALNPKQNTVQALLDNMMVRRERQLAAILFSGTYMTTNTTLSGTSQWSDTTSGVSDPLGVIETAKESVSAAQSVEDEEMTIAMGAAVWRKVRHHPAVVARFQYTSGGGVTRAQFAELCGIRADNFVVGMSNYQSSNEGQSTVTKARIWGNHCLVGFINPSVGLETRTLCSTFQKSEGLRVVEWRNNDPEGDWVRPEWYYDHKVVDASAGYLVINAVA